MKVNHLTPLSAKALGPGKHADGQGLWLVKADKRAGKWILRVVVTGRRREMGFGRWPEVSLAEARDHATAARKQLRLGLDPIVERKRQKYQARKLTVAEATQGCFDARKAELKEDGAAGGWLSPLAVHVIPKIGGYPLEYVDQHVLKEVLAPLWHTKADVARKAMMRMNLVLQHGAALGLPVDLQATMKAKALLGKSRHVATHIPSLPYQDAPAFYRMLMEKDSVTCLALRFLMLTVARTSEVRLATFAEIETDVWVLTAERTKSNRKHRVPLTDEALQVVSLARRRSAHRLLFPSPSGRALSDAAMAKFMKDNGYNERPHGFRATFRTWVEEQTDADYETKEAALGHAVDSGVVRAYQRSDRFEKRRAVMMRWTNYLMD